jgi:predicted lipoprotein with Yx(FWY)xxD motif
MQTSAVRRLALSVCVVVCGIVAAFTTAVVSARDNSAHGRQSDLQATDEVPEGFQVRHTDIGPVFTDQKGMTLYLWASKKGACPTVHDPIPQNSSPLMEVYQAKVTTCEAQWPPVLAPANAKALGEWTIIPRTDGLRQWAFQGLPVHHSYKDRLPGDTNGYMVDAYRGIRGGLATTVAAPLPKLPSGIRVTHHRGVGLVATSADGRALYLLDGSVIRQLAKSSAYVRVSLRTSDATAEERWQPFAAGVLANSIGEWTPLSKEDGIPVWTYHGQLLFTYVGDHEQGDARGLGIDRASLVVLQPEAKAPSGVTVVRTLIGPVFADAKGMTLYTFSCRTPNPAGLDGASGGYFSCDNWTDDPSYSEQYCPARDKCADMWTPYQAPANAHIKGGTWSMAVIPDPEHYPMRWVPSSSEAVRQPGAITVWTHNGHPVYTSKNDQGPAELTSHGLWVLSGTDWSAVLAGVSEER